MLEVHLKEDFKSPWFLAVLGLIGVALAGTIWMAVIAGSTSPGLVSEDYYEKGKNYFHEAPKEASGPQWRLNLLVPATPSVDVAQNYRLYVIDEAGEPVSTGKITLYAYRPSDAEADFSVKMVKADAGSFVASVTFPLPGTWDLIAQIEASGKQMNVTKRLFVRD
ncbi:MAG TPA: FixH family protein [Mariprofundaceae bacterium]|nr:FixH family protein [Mariprofundaceae bacterium]